MIRFSPRYKQIFNRFYRGWCKYRSFLPFFVFLHLAQRCVNHKLDDVIFVVYVPIPFVSLFPCAIFTGAQPVGLKCLTDFFVKLIRLGQPLNQCLR